MVDFFDIPTFYYDDFFIFILILYMADHTSRPKAQVRWRPWVEKRKAEAFDRMCLLNTKRVSATGKNIKIIGRFFQIKYQRELIQLDPDQSDSALGPINRYNTNRK